MGFELVGTVWDVVAFREYVNSLDLSRWSGVTMHHTASPDLSQRPRGFTIQHMRNLVSYYRNNLGWSAGPHLFIDDDQIFGLSSLESRGVHAKSFNRSHLGIEVLGNYDREDPHSGRGAACWAMAAAAVRILLSRMHKDVEAINFHRDEPRTSKSCPGSKVDLSHFRSKVAAIEDRNDPDDELDDKPNEPNDELAEMIPKVIEIHDSMAWQLKKLRKLIP